MWQTAKVKLVFLEKVCGSVPLKKELVGAWLEARMPKKKPEEGKTIEEIKEEILNSIEDVEEKVTLGFQSDSNGLFVRGGTIKAHLKDCANQIKDVLKPQIKALRSKVANKLYIEEQWVHFSKDEQSVFKEDGEFDQPVHVMTALGPRNALKTIRFLTQPSLEFMMRLMEDREVTKEVVEQIFRYGSIHGYGGERGMGEGRYKFEIEWE